MNQILETDAAKFNIKEQWKRKFSLFKLQLIFSLVLVFILFSYYSYNHYIDTRNEEFSNVLLSNYNAKLVSTNTQSTNLVYVDADNKYFVIGVIEIQKLKITYPILSEISNDLLKISVCRFYGPNANEAGNLCIAGHNYKDYRFFSKISELDINDVITIYDLQGKPLDYSVYDKFEVEANDLSCTSQNTNGKKEITLITCDNNSRQKREVIKAVEKQ